MRESLPECPASLQGDLFYLLRYSLGRTIPFCD